MAGSGRGGPEIPSEEFQHPADDDENKDREQRENRRVHGGDQELEAGVAPLSSDGRTAPLLDKQDYDEGDDDDDIKEDAHQSDRTNDRVGEHGGDHRRPRESRGTA